MADEQPSTGEPKEIAASPPIAATPPPVVYTASTQAPNPVIPSLSAVPPSMFGLSIQQGGPSVDPLVAKMTDAHLTQVITQAENDSVRRHTENMFWIKQMTTISIVLIIFVTIICAVFLYYKKAVAVHRVG